MASEEADHSQGQIQVNGPFTLHFIEI